MGLFEWVKNTIRRHDPEVEAVLKDLDCNPGYFPRETLEKAVALRERITPYLLDILRETVRHPEKRAEEDDYFAPIFALMLLGQFREPKAYPLVLKLLRLPEETLEALVGDSFTEDVDRVLAAVCTDDRAPLIALVEDRAVPTLCRSVALSAIPFLVSADRLPRDEAVRIFQRLFTRLERSKSAPWGELVSCCLDIHPGEVIGDVRRVFEEGLVDPSYVGADEVEEALAVSPADAIAAMKRDSRSPDVNVLADMKDWECFESYDDVLHAGIESLDVDDRLDDDTPPDTVLRETPKVGRNDPCPCGSGKKYKKCCGAAA